MFDDGDDFDLGGGDSPPGGSPPETPFNNLPPTGVSADVMGVPPAMDLSPQAPVEEFNMWEDSSSPPQQHAVNPLPSLDHGPQSPTSPHSELSSTAPAVPLQQDEAVFSAASAPPAPPPAPELSPLPTASPVVGAPPSAPPAAPAPFVPQVAEVDPFGGDDDDDPFGGPSDDTDDFLGGNADREADPFQEQPPQGQIAPQFVAPAPPATTAPQLVPQQLSTVNHHGYQAQPEMSTTQPTPTVTPAPVTQPSHFQQFQPVPTANHAQPMHAQPVQAQPVHASSPPPTQVQQPPLVPPSPFSPYPQPASDAIVSSSGPNQGPPAPTAVPTKTAPPPPTPGSTSGAVSVSGASSPGFFTPNAHPGPPVLSSRSSASSVTRSSAQTGPNTPFQAGKGGFVPYKSTGQPSAEGMLHTNSSNGMLSQGNQAATQAAPQNRYNYTRIPCPAVCMTSTGALITSSISGGFVKKQPLSTVLASNQDEHFQQLNCLPGPLDGASGSIKPEQIDQALQTLGTLSAESSRQHQLSDAAGDSARANPACLPQLLAAMVSRPIDWAKDGRSRIAALLKEVETGTLSSDYVHVPQEYMSQAVTDIQDFVLKGDRAEAVTCALHYRQFDMAMLIATTMDKDTYDRVVTAMLKEKLAADNPLGSVLKVFAGLPLDANNSENLSAWQPQIAALLANDTGATAEQLLAWGEALASEDYVSESHFCYLAAMVKPPSDKGPRGQALFEALRSKFTLLGGQHRRDRCRSAYSNPLTVFQTEVLEYTRQKQSSNYRHPTMFQHRLAMAMWYLEVGNVEKANAYLEYLAKNLPTGAQRSKGDPSPRILQHSIQDWRQLVLGYRAGGSSAASASKGWGLFGGGNKAAATTPSPTPQPTSPAARQSPAATPAPKSAPKKDPAPPKQVAPEKQTKKAGSEEKDKDAEGKKKSGWWPWGREEKKKDDVKVMQLDSDAVELDEHGNYKFEQTDEERAVQAQIKAGPPKMPMKAPAQVAPSPTQVAPAPSGPTQPPYTAPPGAAFGGPPTPAQGMHGPPGPGGPPLPGQGAPRAPAQYVDMFNS